MDPQDLEQFTPEEQAELLDAETRMYQEYFGGTAAQRRPIMLATLIAEPRACEAWRPTPLLRKNGSSLHCSEIFAQ